jgi:hypothetical protein
MAIPTPVSTLVNLTGKSISLGGSGERVVPSESSVLSCDQELPASAAQTYYFVPACMAAAAADRMDVVWSPAIPDCSHCIAPAAKRHWFAKRPSNSSSVVVMTVEHQTKQDGWQGVGAHFFQERYLTS